MMAFAHDLSCECTKSELDLFTVPPTQTSMEHGSWVEYHPLSTVTDGSPIEFDVSGTGDDYLDFANTLLHVKAKVVRDNGEDLAADALVGPVNLFLNSLFSQVDISLNVSVQGHDGDSAELWTRRQDVSADVGPVLQRHGRSHGQLDFRQRQCGLGKEAQFDQRESRGRHDGTSTLTFL